MALKIIRAGDPYPYEPRFAPEKVAGWREMLDRRDVLIVDTETTGLGDRDEVIEVAAVDTTGSLRFEALSMPEGPISGGARGAHGLAKEKLAEAGARPWPEVWAELERVLLDARVLLAWNAEFDERLLRQTTERHGCRYDLSPDLPLPLFRCLMMDYMRLRPNPSLYPRGLQKVMLKECALPGRPAHRAKADCLTILSIMRAVVAYSSKDPRGYPSHWIVGHPNVPSIRPPHVIESRASAYRRANKLIAKKGESALGDMAGGDG